MTFIPVKRESYCGRRGDLEQCSGIRPAMLHGVEGVRVMEKKTRRLMGAANTFESIKIFCDTPLSVALLIPSVDVYFRNTRRYQERVLIHKCVVVEQVSRSTQKKVNRLHPLDTHTKLDILSYFDILI